MLRPPWPEPFCGPSLRWYPKKQVSLKASSFSSQELCNAWPSRGPLVAAESALSSVSVGFLGDLGLRHRESSGGALLPGGAAPSSSLKTRHTPSKISKRGRRCRLPALAMPKDLSLSPSTAFEIRSASEVPAFARGLGQCSPSTRDGFDLDTSTAAEASAASR